MHGYSIASFFLNIYMHGEFFENVLYSSYLISIKV